MPTASKVPLRSKPIKSAVVTAITIKVRNAPPDFIPRGNSNINNSTLTTTTADDVLIPSEVGVSTAAAGSKVRLYVLLFCIKICILSDIAILFAQVAQLTASDGTAAADVSGAGGHVVNKSDGKLKDDREYGAEVCSFIFRSIVTGS